MSKITTIPAGKEIRLSQEIYYYMLIQVSQHRLVSTHGYVSDGMCIEKLQAEGLTILPAKGHREEWVLDYKNICSISKRHRRGRQGCFRPNSKRRSMCIPT